MALGSQSLSPRKCQQYMFNAMIFVIELGAICTMVIIAVMFVSTLTSPDVENTSLPLVTTIIGLMAISIPAGGSYLRQSKQFKVRQGLRPINSRRH
jgi:hypothetical protein